MCGYNASVDKRRECCLTPAITTSTWWRHQMESFSALLALCAGNSPVPVNSPHKGQWRGALMFSLICAWINHWVNNREGGVLRRHRGYYDVNVMNWKFFIIPMEPRDDTVRCNAIFRTLHRPQTALAGELWGVCWNISKTIDRNIMWPQFTIIINLEGIGTTKTYHKIDVLDINHKYITYNLCVSLVISSPCIHVTVIE